MGNLTVINITDAKYGAVGDGTTDDTAAINAALKDVPAGNGTTVEPGGIVYFPRGTYVISAPLMRQVSNTRCIGEAKNATTIKIDARAWNPAGSGAEPTMAFMIDLANYNVTDCLISDLTVDGNARAIEATDHAGDWSGILCSKLNIIERVSIYDVWGFGFWVYGDSGKFTRIIDCEADRGGAKSMVNGKDCIGGGAKRISVVRFHWMPGLSKNSAMDMTTSGGEVSVSLYDCANESGKDIILEGATQSVIHGCRFYANQLHLSNDASYHHSTITNPGEITVSDCVFAPWQGGRPPETWFRICKEC